MTGTNNQLIQHGEASLTTSVQHTQIQKIHIIMDQKRILQQIFLSVGSIVRLINYIIVPIVNWIPFMQQKWMSRALDTRLIWFVNHFWIPVSAPHMMHMAAHAIKKCHNIIVTIHISTWKDMAAEKIKHQYCSPFGLWCTSNLSCNIPQISQLKLIPWKTYTGS